ncbi:MAG TPA: signal peptidase II, partial [Candidatus Dormibacteraeota bacterium]|nr:signal peptidase II [Candidatus Dormibacteraeota bacterium]
MAKGRWLWLAAAVLAADQISKQAVSRALQPDALVVVIPGLFNLVHTNNAGVAFGILADAHSPWVTSALILFSLGVMGLLAWFLLSDRIPGRTGQAGAALILGGAAGNVIDRVLRHSVVDFLDFYFRGYHWPAFNLADSAIVIGGGLIILSLL